MSAWIRDKDEADRPPPSISVKDLPTICDALPTLRVVDKQRILLEAIERRTQNPASRVNLICDQDYPLAWATDHDELEYLLDSLQARGHLALVNRQGDRVVESQVTPSGWEYLDGLDRRTVDTNHVFVAMWFDPSMHTAWTDAIRPTIQNVGYRPYRVDDDPSNAERIDAKIQLEIARSRFVIADVTGQRQGVYFEAGYALGLQIPVIWSVRTDNLEQVHFDTRQFPHIVWDNEHDLAQKLESVVIARFGAAADEAEFAQRSSPR
ncbi:MAG: hypothetical protein OXP36_08410 [Gammaproteobacteria bacterium]|nr:hypothetical protein [Gammaproteobacteria bacterium]